METKFAPLVTDLADYFAELFQCHETTISKMNFYGSDFTMKRLGYIALPAVLRGKVRNIKNNMDMPDGPYPPRLDGGYGWFIVDEKETQEETLSPYESGCNITDGENDFIYYFTIGRYFYNSIYHNGGTRWMAANNIIQKTENGFILNDALTEDDRIRLLKNNLIIKDGDRYKLNFAIFNKEQYDSFKNCFDKPDSKLEHLLTELICDIHKSFKLFVPKRLNSQINQWVNVYASNVIGFVTEELINRNVLEKPDDETPLTNGVFCITGEYVDV